MYALYGPMIIQYVGIPTMPIMDSLKLAALGRKKHLLYCARCQGHNPPFSAPLP